MTDHTGVTLSAHDCLWPQWRVAPRVHAFVTTRAGGVSSAPYDGGVSGAGGLNLGFSSGDSADAVTENRRRALALTGIGDAAWLEQIHGTAVEDAHAVIERRATSGTTADTPAGTTAGITADTSADTPADTPAGTTRADASVTDRPGVVCVVMTADCLPVLFCDDEGRAVGAAHAGWRGLAGGIIEKTGTRVGALAGVSTSRLNAYLGPAIGPEAFEVGEDVFDAFVAAADARRRDTTAAAFKATGTQGKYFADIYALARLRLADIGIKAQRVHGGTHCTVTEQARFYSYRRERVTGRMAAMIWLAD